MTVSVVTLISAVRVYPLRCRVPNIAVEMCRDEDHRSLN